jgi:hypothetical protein
MPRSFPPNSSAAWKEKDAVWKSGFVVRKSTNLRDHEQYPDYLRAATNEDDKGLADGILASIQAALVDYGVLLKEHNWLFTICTQKKKSLQLFGVSDRGDCCPTQSVLAATPCFMRCQYSMDDYRQHGLHLRSCAVKDLHALIRVENLCVCREVWNELCDVLQSSGMSSELYMAALREWSNTLNLSSTVADYKATVSANPSECMELYLDAVLAMQSTYVMRVLVMVIGWIFGTQGVHYTIHTMGTDCTLPEAPEDFRTCYLPMWPFDPLIDKVDLVLLYSTPHYLALLSPDWEALGSDIINMRLVSVTAPSFSPRPCNPYTQTLYPIP